MKRFSQILSRVLTFLVALVTLFTGILSYDQARALIIQAEATPWLDMRPDFSSLFGFLLLTFVGLAVVFRGLITGVQPSPQVYRIYINGHEGIVPYDFATLRLAELWIRYHLVGVYEDDYRILCQYPTGDYLIEWVDEIPECTSQPVFTLF